MLFHQLGQYLVLLLQLRLQEGDALFAGLDLFVSVRRRPEGRGPVLEELFQPTVENRGMKAIFLTEIGNRHLVDQVPAQNGDLLFRGVMLTLVAHEFSPL